MVDKSSNMISRIQTHYLKDERSRFIRKSAYTNYQPKKALFSSYSTPSVLPKQEKFLKYM